MPELPEVETMRRGIVAIVGSRIAAADRLRCTRRPILIQPRPTTLAKRLIGREVIAVDRLGKRVVVRIDNGDSLIFEPRMTGLVLVADPPTKEHLRFCLELTGGPIRQVWYWDRRGLGSVRLLTAEQLTSQLGSGKLGPDALQLSAEALQQRLAQSRRAIKVALLDQRAIAGVGNLYASEILHLAGIHPARRCDQLKIVQWQRIHACLIDLLQEAILHEGSTLSDGTYRNALNRAGGYQNMHRVYDREGELCPTCRKVNVVRIVQAQRATFLCPSCQANRRRPGQ